MQEDKEALFDTIDTIKESLRIMSIVLRNIRLDTGRTRSAAQAVFKCDGYGGLSCAQRPRVPSRTWSGGPNRERSDRKREVSEELSLDELHGFSDLFDETIYAALTIESSVGTKR